MLLKMEAYLHSWTGPYPYPSLFPETNAVFFLLLTLGEVFEKSYLGNVTCMDLNRQYAAALYDGHIHLHTVYKSSASCKLTLKHKALTLRLCVKIVNQG